MKRDHKTFENFKEYYNEKLPETKVLIHETYKDTEFKFSGEVISEVVKIAEIVASTMLERYHEWLSGRIMGLK